MRGIEMKMMLVWCFLCSFFALAFGLDVGFSYDTSCFSAGGSVEMTATYTGSGTVTAVQWYYSGQKSENVFVVTSNCQPLTPIDAGYPPVDEMSFGCNLVTNVFKLTLSSAVEVDFDKSWGVTFSLSAGASPDVVQKQIEQCKTTPAPEEGGLEWWQILLIVLGSLLVFLFLAGIILGCILNGNYAAKGNGCCNCNGFPSWYKILWYTVIGIPVALGVLLVWKCC